MSQYVPTYVYDNGSQQIYLGPDSDFWITDVTGGDGIALSINETQSCRQTGTSENSVTMGARDITITGAIMSNLDAHENLLNRIVRPFCTSRLYKTIGNKTWYLEGKVKLPPVVDNKRGYLPFQFKLHCFYPMWRMSEDVSTMLGGLESTWFPTTVYTGDRFWISKATTNILTTVVNDGNVATEFVATIRATAQAVNPVIYHAGTKTYLALQKTMEAGEKAVISTVSGSRGCTYYSADEVACNGFRWMDPASDWSMMLSPGENVLRLTADSGRENLDVRITAPKGVSTSGT